MSALILDAMLAPTRKTCARGCESEGKTVEVRPHCKVEGEIRSEWKLKSESAAVEPGDSKLHLLRGAAFRTVSDKASGLTRF